MASIHSQIPTSNAAPEKYMIAFVIQGDDVFKITADNIIHTTGTATGPAFDAIAKLKAAAALLELTNRHKERPEELRQMARELAGEGMKLMARASSSIRPVPPPMSVEEEEEEVSPEPVSAAPWREAVPPAPAAHAPRSEPIAVPRVYAPITPTGPAPVPKPEERSSDEAALPSNARIALIS